MAQKQIRKNNQIIVVVSLLLLPLAFIIDQQRALVRMKKCSFFHRIFIIHFSCFIKGGRNLLDSSFTLSGKLEFRMKFDVINGILIGNQWDERNQRKTTRVHQPPGGQSKGLREKNSFTLINLILFRIVVRFLQDCIVSHLL